MIHIPKLEPLPTSPTFPLPLNKVYPNFSMKIIPSPLVSVSLALWVFLQ